MGPRIIERFGERRFLTFGGPDAGAGPPRNCGRVAEALRIDTLVLSQGVLLPKRPLQPHAGTLAAVALGYICCPEVVL